MPEPVVVGELVEMRRSGHSAGEAAMVVALHGPAEKVILRLRWPDGRDTFVPLHAVSLRKH